TLAMLIQLAEIGPDCTVLDVGCATGYTAAVLARLARRVVALEADRALARSAAGLLEELGVRSPKVVEGALAAGAPAEGRYDAILLDGAVPAVPPALIDQIADGGRLVAILIEGPVNRAHIWRRIGKTVDCQPAF